MIAKRNIARLWGTSNAPTIAEWELDVDWCMLEEKVVYVSRGCPNKWAKIWGQWNIYRRNICTVPNMAQDSRKQQKGK